MPSPDQYSAYLKSQLSSAISSFTAQSVQNISVHSHSQGVETLLSAKIPKQGFYAKSGCELLAKNLAYKASPPVDCNWFILVLLFSCSRRKKSQTGGSRSA